MAKFYGKVGYGISKETAPGVWVDEIVERPYYGELVRNTRKMQMSDKVIDDINIANEISILADLFARDNFQYMRYVEFMGVKWKVTTIEVQFPRLILSIGGLYNG